MIGGSNELDEGAKSFFAGVVIDEELFYDRPDRTLDRVGGAMSDRRSRTGHGAVRDLSHDMDSAPGPRFITRVHSGTDGVFVEPWTGIRARVTQTRWSGLDDEFVDTMIDLERGHGDSMVCFDLRISTRPNIGKTFGGLAMLSQGAWCRQALYRDMNVESSLHDRTNVMRASAVVLHALQHGEHIDDPDCH